MKTEFERISEIMYTLLEHQPVIDVPYEKINDIAVALVKEGYGKVSEYEAEIERLKAENDANMKYIRMMGIQSHIKTSNEQVKQAKLDVLNRVMTYINNRIENDYGDMSDSVQYLTINIDDFDDFIDELMAEVQNGKDKS